MTPGSSTDSVILAQTSQEEDPLEVFLQDNGPVVGFVVLIVMMLGALIGVYRAIQGRDRALELERIARAKGWRFSPDRIAGANTDLPFETFKRGDGRGTANVIQGLVKGHDVKVFDFWWYLEQDNGYYDSSNSNIFSTGISLGTKSRGRGALSGSMAGDDYMAQVPRRRYFSLSCGLVGIDNVLPHLIITPESLVSKAAGKVGVKDIELESEEFNRRYFIRCDDRNFATNFLDAQMQDFMVTIGGKYTFEARGRNLLVASPLVEAQDKADMMEIVATYRILVPRIIDDMFPPLTVGVDE